MAQTLAQVWPFSSLSLPLVVQHCEVKEGHFVATLQRLALQTHALWRSSRRCPAQTHSGVSSSSLVSWCPGGLLRGFIMLLPQEQLEVPGQLRLKVWFPSEMIAPLSLSWNIFWMLHDDTVVLASYANFSVSPKNDLDQFIASWRCGWGGLICTIGPKSLTCDFGMEIICLNLF